MSQDTGRPTIYAPATAPGRAAIAVIRLSGPQAGPALDHLTGRPRPAPRRATLTALRDPEDGGLLDRALVLWFPGPHSETGEDMAELHLHGGRAVTAGVMAALAAIPGLTLAEPGAFSRQAFANGKLDLTQAEGLADLAAAETAAQQRQALRQLDGELGRLLEGWRLALLRVLAQLEAELDFPDEDLPEGLGESVRPALAALHDAVAAQLRDGGRGERLREGLSIAILGPPNVGKSSLLNRLAARDAAIVSERAGTTRDVIEVAMDLGGFPVALADTAGLRDAADELEQEGIARARRRAESADLRLLVADAREGLPPALAAYDGPDALVVYNKADLAAAPPGALAVSALTGAGLDRLQARLAEMAAGRLSGVGPALTRARHREALGECHAALARALVQPVQELRAEDVRLAARALGRITGRVDVEDILDAVFREFCIGK